MNLRIIVQRTKAAKVIVDQQVVGAIGPGLMLLVGITHEDTIEEAKYCANKIANLRIFEDEAGKMNLSIGDVKGEILSVSQFTLYGDTKKGNRPSFVKAASPEFAEPLYEQFNELLRNAHGLKVETGVFGAMMDIDFINDGPVTLVIEKENAHNLSTIV